MKKKGTLFYLSIGLLFVNNLSAQWKHTTDGNVDVVKIVRRGANIYCANSGGLSVINVASSSKVNFEYQTQLVATDLDLDASGIVYVATKGKGLVKISKGKTEYFNTKNSNIGDNNILSVKVEDFNKIWIGYDSGVKLFDGKKFKAFTFNDSKIGMQFVDRINIAGRRKIFSSTVFQGFSEYNDTTFNLQYASDFGLSGNFYINDAQGYKGSLFLATSLGLIQKNPKAKTVMDKNNGLITGDYVTSIFVDSLGFSWIGTKKGGLVRFNGTNKFDYFVDTNSSYSTGLVANKILSANGSIYIATNKGLIQKFSSSFYTKELSQNGISVREVNAISVRESNNYKYFEAENQLGIFDDLKWSKKITTFGIQSANDIHYATNGNIFVATENTGLYIFNAKNQKWSNYGSGTFVNTNKINGILEDDSNVMWITTANGLIKYKDSLFLEAFSNSSNSQIPTSGLGKAVFDKNRNIFFASTLGLVYWDKKSSVWKYWDMFSSKIPSNTINDIVIDENNTKIMATDKGIIYFDSTFRLISYKTHPIVNDKFTCLSYNRKFKKLYYGTENSGFGRYMNGHFTAFNVLNSELRYNKISCLAYDQINKLFIGYGINGISQFTDNNYYDPTEIQESKPVKVLETTLKLNKAILCNKGEIITLPIEFFEGQYILYSLDGKKILTKSKNWNQIPSNEILSGTYLLKSTDLQSKSLRIIIE